LLEQPQVPRVQVRLVHRPVGMQCDGLRIVLHRPPEVGDEGVDVVDRLDARHGRTREENRQRSGERLDVIRHVTEGVPDQLGGS
jgi:hypothetical protein